MRSIIPFINLLTLVAATHPQPTPAPTPAAILPRTLYTPTDYWDYATTPISMDEYYLGVIKIKGPESEFWSLSCMNSPLTVSGSYAGCGLDDLYTSCSGVTAYGADGRDILCDNGYYCVSHSIFEDFTAYNASSSTNFIGCGKATATMEIIRTTTMDAEGPEETGGRAEESESVPGRGVKNAEFGNWMGLVVGIALIGNILC